jgi:hypothetical protein
MTVVVPSRRRARDIARLLLATFLLTFIAARVMVLLIITHRVPDLYLFIGQTHVHHLNYGIYLLTAVGAYLLFFPTICPPAYIVVGYGLGLALTFDEFGMWLHLGGPYWQRASFDAVVIIASLLSVISLAPDLRRFRPLHWLITALLLLLLGSFLWLTTTHWEQIANRIAPRFQQTDDTRR